MKAVRRLRELAINNHYISADLADNALVEIEAVEETFAEIAKLQQQILGDSKPICGTAHNKPMPKPCVECGVKQQRDRFAKRLGIQECSLLEHQASA